MKMKMKSRLRRDFLKFSALTLAGAAWTHSVRGASDTDAPAAEAGLPSDSKQTIPQEIDAQHVINLIIQKCVQQPLPQTVDTVKTGDPSQKVTAIVTTFMATREVIQKAVQLGANLVITHEPTFWNHLDSTQWLESDAVYRAKRQLIDDNRVIIWRCHDYWHSLQPDPVNTGLLKELGWEKYADADRNNLCTIPPVSLRELAGFFKDRLKLKAVQVVGNTEMRCGRVAFAVGASGGRPQIELLGKSDVDVVVAGDINEWEACEYVRDATRAGINKGYLVIGHASSEEPGMKYLAQWLRPMLPQINIFHVPAGDPFGLL